MPNMKFACGFVVTIYNLRLKIFSGGGMTTAIFYVSNKMDTMYPG
jgi:hypothetical protein